MGKAILMSIQPQWLAKILNGVKTIEIRKKFPKDYVGWVYIYCTKKCNITQDNKGQYVTEDKNCRINPSFSIHGKVVARFWCDKVEEINGYKHWNSDSDYDIHFETETLYYDKLLEKSCLDNQQLEDYLEFNGYAIHISKLEVFDKPMLLTMFRKPNFNKVQYYIYYNRFCNRLSIFERLRKYSITKAPQSWCYIYEQEHKKI